MCMCVLCTSSRSLTHKHRFKHKHMHTHTHDGSPFSLSSSTCICLFCHFCSLSSSSECSGFLFVCLWVPSSVYSPKLAARHVWRIDWFDFHKMKDWQEDNSSLVSVSEQMDTSPLHCLSHK